jgi:drug/metabolite transporter (DMT)-like permease
LHAIPREYAGYLRIRSWTGVIANLIVAVGIMVVPLVVTNVVCNLSPFFTVLLAYCYLKEDFLWIEILAMFVSFGAIGMIAYGAPSENNQQREIIDNLDNRIFYYLDGTTRYLVGIMILLLCGFLHSVTYITSRQMKKLHWSIIQYNYALIGIGFVGVLMASDMVY